MNTREKVSLQEFSVDTTLAPEAIREAGQRAAEAGTRFLECKVVEHGVAESTISYAISSSGGILSNPLMDLTVSWEDIAEGQRRVTLHVGDFATKRWVLLGFIPVSPKTPTAMGSLKRFSERLRKDLS